MRDSGFDRGNHLAVLKKIEFEEWTTEKAIFDSFSLSKFRFIEQNRQMFIDYLCRRLSIKDLMGEVKPVISKEIERKPRVIKGIFWQFWSRRIPIQEQNPRS